jgi:hypothetical protein
MLKVNMHSSPDEPIKVTIEKKVVTYPTQTSSLLPSRSLYVVFPKCLLIFRSSMDQLGLIQHQPSTTDRGGHIVIIREIIRVIY